jgi:hypothetical protein
MVLGEDESGYPGGSGGRGAPQGVAREPRSPFSRLQHPIAHISDPTPVPEVWPGLRGVKREPQ